MTNQQIEYSSTRLAARRIQGTARLIEFHDQKRVVVAEATVVETTETKAWKGSRRALATARRAAAA